MEKDGDSEEDNDEEVVKQVLKRRFEGGMRLCQLFLASRISRHIFLAMTTKTNTSGNT